MTAKKPLKTPAKKTGGTKKSPAASKVAKKTSPAKAVKKVAIKTAGKKLAPKKTAPKAKPGKIAPVKVKAPVIAKPNLKKTTKSKPASTEKKATIKTAAKKEAKTATKVPAKKTGAKSPATKPAAKPVAKPAAKKNVAKATPKKPSVKTLSKPVSKTTATKQPTRAKAKQAETEHFSAEELQNFYLSMLDMAKRLSVQVTELRQQSLLRHDEVNQDEDGTDAFERVTSLDRASADQSQIFQINKAIEAINDGSYGICDICSHKIEKRRLKALPFAKTCIHCQSEMEDSGNRRKPTTDLWD